MVIDENSSEQKYNNMHYLNSYKIPSILTIFMSNGEWDPLHSLNNAFDGDFDSYWKSLKYQNDSFINNVVISFSTTVSIDRILYQAPSFNDIIGEGYPTELKIYYKLKNSDGSYKKNDTDFILIDDIISERTGNKVVFILDQVIECDQIKLEWAQIEQADYSSEYLNACASEIMPLFPENEYLNKLLFDVFDENDYYKMTINPEYNDLLAIQEIEENIQDYLGTYKYIGILIERAKKIIDGEIKYEKRREFTTNPNAETNRINQYGDIYNYTKNTLRMSRGSNDRQPTGIYAFGGETITIFVEANDSDPLPIILCQYIGLYNDRDLFFFRLKRGINSFTVYSFNTNGRDDIKSGGPIYFENGYTSEEQSQNVKIYIEGGVLFPLFRINDNEEDFKQMLTDYISEYSMNKLSYFDIAEFYSDKIIITLSATYANEMYINQNESPQKNLLSWDKILKDLYKFDGIQFESNQPYYNIKNEYIKIHIRYATIADQEDNETHTKDRHIIILTQEHFKNCLVSYKGISRSLAHEIGNIIDIIFRTNEEKTNYMLEEYAVQVLFNNLSNITNNEILHNEIAPDNIDNLLRNCGEKENCKGFYINSEDNKYSHYIWWAIESFYPGYWGKLDNLYRYNASLIFGMKMNEAMIFLTSLILGFNIEYYFERFGLAMSNETIFNKSETTDMYKNRLEKAINENKIKTGIYKKLWYADNKQYNYTINNGTGCYKNNNDYEIKIKDINRNENLGITNLTFEEINCQGHLGFEVIENDVVIGFTSKNYFVDKNEYPSDYKFKYKIIAYDRLLDTKESNDATIE